MPTACRQTATLRKYPNMDLLMANHANNTDEDLLRLASNGDERASANLYGFYPLDA
jgi:hypothetical protein